MSIWPENRPFALGLSHDVDRIAKRGQFLYDLARGVKQFSPKAIATELSSLASLFRGDDPYWNFERIMALEESLGVRSTFFFLNERGKARIYKPRSNILYRGRYEIDDPKIVATMRTLAAKGWEVGLHGSYLSYDDVALLSREKEYLELLLSQKVIGGRQHYLRLAIPETWRIHQQIGLAYDSSLGFSKDVGFPSQEYFPFYPEDPADGKPIPVLQIPMGIMDGPLMKYKDPWKKILDLVSEAESKEGTLTLNWHQRVFNNYGFADRQDLYARTIEECQQRGAWIVPLRDICEHWIRTHPLPL